MAEPLKPGWQTSEAWIALLGKILSACVAFGVISAGAEMDLIDLASKAIMGVFAVITIGGIAKEYIRSRTDIKGRSMTLPLILMALLLLPGLASAQAEDTSWFPWRDGLERRIKVLENNNRAPQTDPALAALLGQLAASQQQIALLLAQQHAPGAPGTQPQIIVLGPLPQQLPIAGTPQQVLPIAGAPQQVLPIQGVPQQQLPIQGAPQQQLPIQGAPQQQLPIQSAPQQSLPIQVPPQPATPRAPVGYQQYQSALWRPVQSTR